jgi:cytosine permease
VKTWRGDLEESRALGRVPVNAPQWVPVTLVLWVAATLIGKYVSVGLPSINSLLVAFLGYVVLGKLGLVRGYGAGRTETFDADDAARAAATAVA